MSKSFKRTMAVTLTAAIIGLSAGRASAMLAPTPTTANAAVSAVRANDLKTVQTFLERKEVQQRLTGFGLSSDQIQSRVNNLSDEQLHHVALRIHQQNPAGDGAGVVITVLVIGILALLFVYLLKRV